jgi:purine-binding chemotaxis protein CheW
MSDQSDRQIVVCSLGDEEYAFPIESVHEIIRRTEPRSVASPDPGVRGIISLRGRIVPVHDLSTRLGIAASTQEEWKIVILENGGEVAGVIVDDVQEVLTIPCDKVEEVPVGTDDAIAGVANLGDRIIALLDPSLVSGRSFEIAQAEAEAAAGPAHVETPAAAPARVPALV